MRKTNVYRSLLNRRNLATFFGYVRVDDNGCWIWTGPRCPNGYGKHHNRSAHRTAYMWFGGPIPPGYDVDHLCRVPACVNPAHLEAVTRQENCRRRVYVPKTHCKRGHDLSVAGRAYRLKDGRPHRVCTTCRNEQWNRLYHAKKGRAA